MVHVRILEVPATGEDRLAAMGAEIRRLQRQHDRSILYISAERPAENVLEGLTKAGADRARIFILDVVSGLGGTRTSSDPDHIMYVAGPDLLEMIALRAEKVIRSKAEGPAHIIVDSIQAFSLYNDPDTLKEMVHYAVQRLQKGMGLDFLTTAGVHVAPDLMSFLSAYVEETVQLG